MKTPRKLWEATQKQNSEIQKYINWLRENEGLHFSTYDELWNWSVNNVEAFWETIVAYFNINFESPYSKILSSHQMPGTKWFQGATLNFAEHILDNYENENPAMIAYSEVRGYETISWTEVLEKTIALQNYLRKNGVQKGDRVVAYVSNIPEAIISLLAVASLGAIWSATSPDFGTESVISRFKQIEPKILIAVDGYIYGGKAFDRTETVKEIIASLPTLEKIIVIPYLNEKLNPDNIHPKADSWKEITCDDSCDELTFEYVEFSHPLWVLYSSGTTGLPKPITHSQGGILLEHYKYLNLHAEMKEGDKFFWFTTTGWMMWNMVVGSLLVGATALLFDGNPLYPNENILWEFAEKTGMTFFGTSAPYILHLQKIGFKPKADLSKLKAIGSTGAPLTPEGFDWIYENVKKDIWLTSLSGGTDVCTAFVGGNYLLPVYEGEIQCRCLGAKVEAFDEQGNSVINEVGELVLTEPLPSMPVFFWGDENFKRYKESYFSVYPGIWRHGDWVKITDRNSVIIYGRSDATLKRQGVRMGTAEFYSVVNQLPEIQDSLIISVELPKGQSFMPLFVKLEKEKSLSEELIKKIRKTIRENLSPRHLPDAIVQVNDIPYTLNGKKMETPIKKIFLGFPTEKAVNKDAMKNPEIVGEYLQLKEKLLKKL